VKVLRATIKSADLISKSYVVATLCNALRDTLSQLLELCDVQEMRYNVIPFLAVRPNPIVQRATR